MIEDRYVKGAELVAKANEKLIEARVLLRSSPGGCYQSTVVAQKATAAALNDLERLIDEREAR